MHGLTNIYRVLNYQRSSILGRPATQTMVNYLKDCLSDHDLPHPSESEFWIDYLCHDGIAFNGGCLFSVSSADNTGSFDFHIPHLFDENFEFHQKYRNCTFYSKGLYLIGRNDDCLTLYDTTSSNYLIAAREDLLVYSQSHNKESIVAECLYIDPKTLA